MDGLFKEKKTHNDFNPFEQKRIGVLFICRYNHFFMVSITCSADLYIHYDTCSRVTDLNGTY